MVANDKSGFIKPRRSMYPTYSLSLTSNPKVIRATINTTINWDTGNLENTSFMFEGALTFNSPVSLNMAKVKWANAMFIDSIFNRNISNWCVPLLTSEPVDFSTNSSLTPPYKPVWGTCPSGLYPYT